MDSFVMPQKPGYPKGFANFFAALQDGMVRTLSEYYLLLDRDGRKDLETQARQCQEFLAFQDILFEVSAMCREDSKEVFLATLYKRLHAIWPPAPPAIIVRLRDLICVTYDGSNEQSVFVLQITDLPEDVQFELNALREGTVAEQEDYLAIVGAFEAGFNASGFAGGVPEDSRKRGPGIGRYKGAFNKTIALRWPAKDRPKIVKKEKPKTRTEGALVELERRFYYEAVCHLLLGEFTALDPVIGDEACEARPPILMDAWQTLMEMDGETLKHFLHCAVEYRLRHRQDPDPTQIRVESDFTIDEGGAKAFVSICNDLSFKLPVDYLVLCKANTVASELATDEWGMASFDRNKGLYSDFDRAVRRSRLSEASVGCIRFMAKSVLRNEHCTGPLFGEICNVLDTVNVVKLEEIEIKGESGEEPVKKILEIRSLPIYEMMRTVVAYEYVKQRPIILSVFQIECTPDGDPSSKECPATYKLKRVQTCYYKPNPAKNRYVPMEISSLSKQDRERPCLAIQAYQLVSPVNAIPLIDGLFFNSLGSGYEDALFSCDLSLLIQCYAAIHPIFAGDPYVCGGDHIEDPLGYMDNLHDSICITETPDWDEGETRRSNIFNLVKTTRTLRQEYAAMRALAIACDVGNKQYIKRLLGDAWGHLTRKTLCARTLESCGFTIHHINMNSFDAVLERDKACLGIPELQRFHEFDGKKSYVNLDEFK